MLTRSAGSALRDRILVRQPGLELLRSAKLLEQHALGEARRVQGVGGALSRDGPPRLPVYRGKPEVVWCDGRLHEK